MGTVKEGWVGRFFEDFEVGDIYRCRLGRTITETDNIQFTLLTNNTNQIHFNAHYASRTEFKRPLVNSAMTLSVVAGLGVPRVVELFQDCQLAPEDDPDRVIDSPRRGHVGHI